MKRDGLTRALLAAALLASGACDSWHGDNQWSQPTQDGENPPLAKPDAGPTPKGDAGDDPDADVTTPADAGGNAGDDAGGDAGLPAPTRGDERAGYVACGGGRCEVDQLCCSGRGAGDEPRCADHCGGTEHALACDGAEDCQAGEVCCLQEDVSGRRLGTCLAPGIEATSDAGPAPVCAGANEHVACHVDADCTYLDKTFVCRAPAGDFSDYGSCGAPHDDLDTPGHDEEGRVSCGADACGAAGELCCASANAPGVLACGTDAACGHSEYPVTCDGPEDCGGTNVCCFVPAHDSPDAGTTQAATMCVDACEGEGALVRCHRKDDCGAAQDCVPDSDDVSFWGHCAPAPG